MYTQQKTEDSGVAWSETLALAIKAKKETGKNIKLKTLLITFTLKSKELRSEAAMKASKTFHIAAASFTSPSTNQHDLRY